MADYPPVWVLFTTYKRTAVAVQTAHSLVHYLDYPNLHYHVCDEGSITTDDGTNRMHIEVITEIFGEGCTSQDMATPRGQFNLGGNVNAGIKKARWHGVFHYFIVEDDTTLATPLDLRPYVDVLTRNPQAGYIRLNYNAAGLVGEVVDYPAPSLGENVMVPFLRIRRSLSKNHYVPAFNPALIHYRFIEAFGWYPENLHPGLTETGMCNQYKERETEDTPQVLTPIHHWPRGVVFLHAAGRANDYKDFSEGRLEWSPPETGKS